MDALQSVPDRVAAARVDAKTQQDRISEILSLLAGQIGSDAQREDLRAATVALETVAIDTFSFFESRMQHHFRRGPFSRKLTSLLVDTGHADLAGRVHQYYLAINVLKHGTGASYRELRDADDCPFVLKPAEVRIADDALPLPGLIDVTANRFFEGMAATILEAADFLENRPIS